MRAGLGLLRRRRGAGGGGGAPVTYLAPFQDDFVGAASDINGRVADGKAWFAGFYTGGALTMYRVDGAGKVTASGTGGQKAASFVGYQNAPVGVAEWASFRWAGATLNQQEIHLQLTLNASTATQMKVLWTGSGNSGTLIMQPFIANVGTTQTAAMFGANVLMLDGDIVQARFSDGGAANVLMALYHNGMLVQQNFDITAQSIPATHLMALGGASAFTNGSLDDIQVVDPATHGAVNLINPHRINQLEAAGDLKAKVRVEFTRTEPAALLYTLFDKATGLAVTGHSAQTIAGLTNIGGVLYGETLTIAAGVLPASYRLYVWRSDMVGGSTLGGSYSPTMKGGEVILYEGQSLTVNHLVTSATATSAQPTDVWVSDGGIEYVSGGEIASRYNRATVNTTQSVIGNRWRSKVGTIPLTLVRAGKGATKIIDRAPGGVLGYHDQLIAGLRRAGGRASSMIDNSGEFDVAAADRATYVAYLNAIIDDIEAKQGHPIVCYISPVGAIHGGNAADVDAMRFMQWRLTQPYHITNNPTGNPGRFKLLNYKHGIQHANNDAYHFAVAGMEEQGKLEMDGVAFHRGTQADGRFGPLVVSGVLDNDHQVTLTLAVGASTGLQVRNGGATTGLGGTPDWRAGLRYAAASSFASPLNPTGVTVNGTPAGGFQTITSVFAGTPFSGGSAFVSGYYGSNGFNPENNTTINNGLAANGVQLESLFTGEAAVGVQPTFNVSGNNYVVVT